MLMGQRVVVGADSLSDGEVDGEYGRQLECGHR